MSQTTQPRTTFEEEVQAFADFLKNKAFTPTRDQLRQAGVEIMTWGDSRIPAGLRHPDGKPFRDNTVLSYKVPRTGKQHFLIAEIKDIVIKYHISMAGFDGLHLVAFASLDIKGRSSYSSDDYELAEIMGQTFTRDLSEKAVLFNHVMKFHIPVDDAGYNSYMRTEWAFPWELEAEMLRIIDLLKEEAGIDMLAALLARAGQLPKS
jgi:hypothetical protein